MKSSHLILIFSCFLGLLFFLILWLTDYSPFNIPEFIPGIELQTYGVLTFLVLIVGLILFQKQLIRRDPTIGVARLTLLGCFVCLIAQSIYQAVRQFYVLRFNENDKVYDLTVSLISIIILSAIISFSVALELKKSKPIWRTVSNVLVLAVFFLTRKYFPTITW